MIQLSTKQFAVADHFIFKTTVRVQIGKIMFCGNDSSLDSANSFIVVKTIERLLIKDFVRGEEGVEGVCDAEGCPDLPALPLCCCKLNMKLSRNVAHLSFF